MLLNAAKFQGYSFYHFRVIRGKPTWGKIIPPSQIRVYTSKTIKRHNVDFLHVGTDLLKLQVHDVILGGRGQECPKRVLKP